VKKVDARNADYWRIVSELEAQAPPSFLKRREKIHQQQTQFNGGEHLLDSVDHVIFCGDLNYRIDLPREFTMQILKELNSSACIQNNRHEAKSIRMSLLRHDQLLRTISEGRAFIGMSEGEITFPPTFKFDKGTHAYDTQKLRVPAWTDRILFRPKGVRVHEYKSVQDAMHSDHRPVYATLGLSMIGRELTSQKRVHKRRKRGKGQRVGM
jgi:Phosphatidylinositol 5-phosphate phosphatase